MDLILELKAHVGEDGGGEEERDDAEGEAQLRDVGEEGAVRVEPLAEVVAQQRRVEHVVDAALLAPLGVEVHLDVHHAGGVLVEAAGDDEVEPEREREHPQRRAERRGVHLPFRHPSPQASPKHD